MIGSAGHAVTQQPCPLHQPIGSSGFVAKHPLVAAACVRSPCEGHIGSTKPVFPVFFATTSMHSREQTVCGPSSSLRSNHEYGFAQ
jgi:hypothetical protein